MNSLCIIISMQVNDNERLSSNRNEERSEEKRFGVDTGQSLLHQEELKSLLEREGVPETVECGSRWRSWGL